MDGGASEQGDEFGGVRRRYSRLQFRVSERTFELGQQVFGGDELEVPSEPTRKDLRRRPARREHSRVENVGVEDSSHSAPTTPSLVLSLDGERSRLFLGQIVPSPDSVEQIESELAPERLLDDFTVALAYAGRANRPERLTSRSSGRPRTAAAGVDRRTLGPPGPGRTAP